LICLIDNWAQGEQPIHAYLPVSRLLNGIKPALALRTRQPIKPGHTLLLNQLHLHILPFLPQTDYDRLLWLCDLNFVRGEESMARAQWAGKPFIWHIYPTEDGAHMTKLNAFWQTYWMGSAGAENPLWQANVAWNQQQLTGQLWDSLQDNHPKLAEQAKHWVTHVNQLGELTGNLIRFIQTKSQAKSKLSWIS
jgi:uncharacterized repeat protein (TIGR03837 family)